MEKYQADETQR